MDNSQAIAAVKTKLLEVVEGCKPLDETVNQNDAMSREIARYFNSSAKSKQQASIKRLSMFTFGETGPDRELYIETVLKANQPKMGNGTSQ